MPQQTNLNVSPYFDDYDPTSDYHKVLFKPGYPVQARELSNLQSILQNQIEKFGQHFFKEGAKVILTDVNREVLDSMSERLSDFSKSQFQAIFHDVTQEESWIELINKTESDQGKINILVNSAGISLGADIVSTDFDIWKKVKL